MNLMKVSAKDHISRVIGITAFFLSLFLETVGIAERKRYSKTDGLGLCLQACRGGILV